MDTQEDAKLNFAGYGYLIGDATLCASGLLSGRPKEALSGLLWGASGLTLAMCGKESAERKLRTMASDLKAHLKAEGITIPEGAALNSKELAKKDGVIDRIQDFFYAYPSQIANALFALGGAQLIHSGISSNKKWDAASGALVTAGALAGLLIPEKAPDKHHPAQGFFGKAMEWAQEKPLRVSGSLYTLNNFTLMASAIKERSQNPLQKSYVFKMLTAASYMLANTMLAGASKDAGEQHSSDQKHGMHAKLAQAAAQVIAAQPVPLQEAAIRHTAGYLAAQPGIGATAQELASEMQQYVAQQLHAPKHVPWQQRINTLPSDTLALTTR